MIVEGACDTEEILLSQVPDGGVFHLLRSLRPQVMWIKTVVPDESLFGNPDAVFCVMLEDGNGELLDKTQVVIFFPDASVYLNSAG